jgi:hypothetical protein
MGGAYGGASVVAAHPQCIIDFGPMRSKSLETPTNLVMSQYQHSEDFIGGQHRPCIGKGT